MGWRAPGTLFSVLRGRRFAAAPQHEEGYYLHGRCARCDDPELVSRACVRGFHAFGAALRVRPPRACHRPAEGCPPASMGTLPDPSAVTGMTVPAQSPAKV